MPLRVVHDVGSVVADVDAAGHEAVLLVRECRGVGVSRSTSCAWSSGSASKVLITVVTVAVSSILGWSCGFLR